MKNKEKPCKGINKANKFKGCGNVTPFRVYGLCNNCYKDWLLNTDEGQEKINKSILKAKTKRVESINSLKKYDNERKEIKRLSALIGQVKKYCHEYIRERDKGKNCISCGFVLKGSFDAGHYFKSELYSSLKFNEDNIHGQCVQCNRRLEGNLNKYSLDLPGRIGNVKFDKLNYLANLEKQILFKWDRESLKVLRDYYRRKLNNLK